MICEHFKKIQTFLKDMSVLRLFEYKNFKPSDENIITEIPDKEVVQSLLAEVLEEE